MKSGIYKIKNLITEKCYIGSSFDIEQRFYFHKYHLNKGTHKNGLLQNSWIKHGKHNFVFYVLEYCEIEKLFEMEQFYIDKYKSAYKSFGYNLKPVAGSTLGYKHTEAALAKMKGGGFKGKTWSAEHKAKFISKIKGVPKSEEHKEKIRQARIGVKSSEETKAKHRLNNNGDGNPNRDLLKWPHKDGKKCKCEECVIKKRKMKNEYNKMWRNS